MIRTPLVFTFLALALNGVCLSRSLAHHGPPHEEVDEFDSPAARLMAPMPGVGLSWPVVVLSLAGVAVVYAFSRRHGVDASGPASTRAGR